MLVLSASYSRSAWRRALSKNCSLRQCGGGRAEIVGLLLRAFAPEQQGLRHTEPATKLHDAPVIVPKHGDSLAAPQRTPSKEANTLARAIGWAGATQLVERVF